MDEGAGGRILWRILLQAGNAEQATGCSYLCSSPLSGLENAAATSMRSVSALAAGFSLIIAPSVKK